MSTLLPRPDPDGLLEFSVVYTDHALNHMSRRFQGVMRDISATLKAVYGAHACAIVPGSGTCGMEAVARQFAQDQRVLIVRNGFFSYRWSQILETGRITAPEHITVMQAQRVGSGDEAPFAPAPIEAVREAIARQRPAVVFAPHVETASGMLLSDDYVRQLAQATQAVGGLFVLDCIASGALWVNMADLGVDVLISAPQKSWSSTPCGALVCLSERASQALAGTSSSSFALDLKKWRDIMAAYENGAHAYHATMPTDSLASLHTAMQAAHARGFDSLRQQQIELGRQVRALLQARGFASVAAEGWQAPGVVVSYTRNPAMQNASAFVQHGVQAAAGVPLMVGEGAGFASFRLGLFGLDKLAAPERCVAQLTAVLDKIAQA